MLSKDETEWLKVAIQQIDSLLRGMADFRQYPDLVARSDSSLQSLLDHLLASVRDARTLSRQALARIENASQSARETAAQAAETPAIPPPDPRPAVPRTVLPPANIEQITMANPTGMRQLILVADHEPASLGEIEAILTEEDYRVLSVRDAFEAISIYARLWAAIDLVILDFSMPMMSGELIFEELQAINPQVAVVISGGFTHPDKLSQMLARGLSGFLPKPFDPQRLLRQIEQVMAHRPPTGGSTRL